MAVTFNGSTDVGSYGDQFDLGSAGTYMVWINPSAIGTTTMVFGKFNGVSSDFAIYSVSAATNALNCRVINGGIADGTTPNSVIANGTWAHIALVYDGGGATNADKLKIYINGVLQTLTFSGTVQASYAGSTTAFQIAQNVGAGEAGLPGDYAHFKCWMGVALTAGEILTEAYSWRPKRTKDLSVWTAFEDGLAGNDYSGAGLTCTITGGTSVVTAPPIDYGGFSLNRRREGYRTGHTKRQLPISAPTLQPPRHMWFGGLAK